MFAELFRESEAGRARLLGHGDQDRYQALVAHALHVCENGPEDEALFALELLDLVPIRYDRADLLREAVRILSELCRPDRDVEVLAAALPVYGRYMPEPPAVRTLLAMTGHPASKVRAGAADGIHYFGDEGTHPPATMELVERLTRLLTGDPDARVRNAAATSLIGMEGWYGYEKGRFPRLIPLVVAALGRAVRDDPDQRVRGTAAWVLAGLSDLDEEHWPLVAETLRPHIEDGDMRVESSALARVASLGDTRAMDRLCALMSEPEVNRRYLFAAGDAFASSPHVPAGFRRRLLDALHRLRDLGWPEDPGDLVPLPPEERTGWLDRVIGRLGP